MVSFRTHLTVLESTAARLPSTPVFRVPSQSPTTGPVESWLPITYRQFLHDVELMSKYWARTLSSKNIPRESVVGLWYVLTNIFLETVAELSFTGSVA